MYFTFGYAKSGVKMCSKWKQNENIENCFIYVKRMTDTFSFFSWGLLQ